MDSTNQEKQESPEEARLLNFPHLPNDAVGQDGKPILNKYSSTITKDHDFPGAQVRAPEGTEQNTLFTISRPCCTQRAYPIDKQ